MLLVHSTCLLGVWQWLEKLGAWPGGQDAPLSGHTASTGLANFEQIWQSTLDGNDVLWCVPLSMELVIAADGLDAPFRCVAVNWQT